MTPPRTLAEIDAEIAPLKAKTLANFTAARLLGGWHDPDLVNRQEATYSAALALFQERAAVLGQPFRHIDMAQWWY